MHHTAKAMHEQRGLYWHIYPTAEQGRKVIWTGMARDGQRIMEWVFPKAIRKSPREWSPQGEMVVELKCGSVWRLMGSDKMDIVGAGPKGVLLSEFALAKPTTWDLIRPMLRESRGWAWIFSTPRGRNHLHKVYEQARQPGSGWFADLQTVLTVGLTYASTRRPGTEIGPEEMMAEELAEGMPQELIDQEYLCSWSAANVGSFYGILLGLLEARGGIGVPFASSGDEVFTSWDLGRADDAVIWWWRLREGSTQEAPRVDVLDHYAHSGTDTEHYFQVLEERAARYGWKYRKHWLPHDARAKTMATKQSVMEQFVARYGVGAVGIAPNIDLDEGIRAFRWLLQKDVRFHPRCSEVADPLDCDGVEALRAYHRTWDDERKCFSQAPVHDWSSHTADAGRYMAVVVKMAELMTRERREPRPPPPPPVIPTRPTMDQLWQSHRSRR